MSDSYNANIYLKPSDLNNIEDRIEELTEECQERIFGKDDTTYSGTGFQIDTHDVIQGYLTQIDGQTSQNGTPTPSSPQPINITTGRQVVRVCEKNILDLSGFITHNNYGGLNISYSNGKLLIDGTATGNVDMYLLSTGWNTKAQELSNIINSQISYLTLSSTKSGLIYYFQMNGAYIQNTINRANPTDNITNMFVRIPRGTSLNNEEIGIQLERNSQPSTYEEYIGNDYEINLGKNLFYINDCSLSQNGGTVSVSNGNTISITGTFSAGTNFSFDSYVNFSSANSQLGNTMTLSVQNIVNSGTTSITPNRIFLGSVDTLLYMQPNQTTGIITKTLGETLNRCRLYVPAGTYNTTFNVQLEKGSSASSFSPYKTPIYLGKIGTYQNYIFRNTQENPLYDSNLEEGQWYIHKEIGRVVLNGSEVPWARSGASTDTLFVASLGLNYLDIYSKRATGSLWLTNRFSVGTGLAQENKFYTYNPDTTWGYRNIGFTVNSSIANDINTFKTWLSTHNLELYYILNTPTNTLIEDEELINQLESIQLISGLNNIIVSSSNLSGIITIQSYLASFYRNIEVGDDLGGKTLYLSLPRTIHESIPDTDTSSHPFISMDVDAYIVYRYVGGYKYIGIRLPDPDNPNNHSIYYFYGYSTANQKGNPYLNHVRYTLPKNFGKVVSINKNNDIFKYIKIYDEKLIPNYEKHIWVDNEQVTMQKIDHIEKGVNNIGLYYEKPNGWVNEKEWLPTANKKYHSNYGVGIKTISYQDLNRWYNNLDLIDFSDLNEITVWNAIDDISQIEWNGESDEEWVDNFNLVLYDFTTEDNNTLTTENGDTMLVLVNERV